MIKARERGGALCGWTSWAGVPLTHRRGSFRAVCRREGIEGLVLDMMGLKFP